MINRIYNVLENSILLIIGVIIGGLMAYYVSVGVLDNQKEIIEQAISKQTTSIVNEFDKIKNKKGEPININLNNQAVTNLDSIDKPKPIRKKFNWWKK